MNAYEILARAILQTSKRSYKTVTEIEDINKRFDRIETKIDQIAQKMGLYKNRAYSDAIRPFDDSERNRASEKKEANSLKKEDPYDGR